MFLEEGHTYSPSVKARIIENVENTGENQHIFKMYSNHANHCYEGRRVHSGIPVGEFLKSQLETYTHIPEFLKSQLENQRFCEKKPTGMLVLLVFFRRILRRLSTMLVFTNGGYACQIQNEWGKIRKCVRENQEMSEGKCAGKLDCGKIRENQGKIGKIWENEEN